MNKLTFNGFNANVSKVAFKVVDLCASIEDVMYEIVKGIETSDGVYPVYIDAEAKKNTMLAIKELNHLVSIMVSNDDVPSKYIDTDIVFKDFSKLANAVNSDTNYSLKNVMEAKGAVNGMYGKTIDTTSHYPSQQEVDVTDNAGRSKYREALNKWMNDD